MKLTVQKGELTLPENFSFEIEQNSAFFSSDGAASVAATIPATPADQEKLGFPTRTARRYRFANLYPATIESGAFQSTDANRIDIPENVNSIADDAFDEGVVLRVVPGSYAEQWAVSHDWPHVN